MYISEWQPIQAYRHTELISEVSEFGQALIDRASLKQQTVNSSL